MKPTFLKISLVALLLILPCGAPAEVIHLKDGTTIKVSKTWEDGGWVRFYLKDYDGIVITYAKDIIDRIESDDGRVLKTYAEKPPEAKPEQQPKAGKEKPAPSKAAAAKPTKSKPKAPAATAGKKPVKPQPAQQPPQPQPAQTPPPAKAAAAPAATAPQPAPASKPQASPPMASAADSKQPSPAAPAAKPKQSLPSPSATAEKPQSPKAAAKAAKPPAAAPPARDAYSAYQGLQFYNPRRAYKYWSGPNTKHHTLEEAVAALAEKFDRSPEWVQQHLGDTNDLAQIYRNLSGSPVKKTIQTDPEALAANGLLFYDPRRHYKFHLSEKLKFRTLDEATAALARQYDRSPQWVKQNLGETNDVGEIHRNLARAKAAETQ
jgi:hypothetical protein